LDRTTCFLIIDPETLRFYQRYPSVLVMDCTYRWVPWAIV
jgi:hypothetical protein